LKPSLRTPAGAVRRFVYPGDLECRDSGAEAGAYKIVGHAAVFDKPCDFRYFTEYIAPGAFEKALQADPLEVVSNWQHDDRWILGHTLNDTLILSEDGEGLLQSTKVAPTSWGSDLRILLERGDIQQASFCFTINAETWEYADEGTDDEEVTVTITEIGTLYDVTVCALGAYPQTDVSIASRDRLDSALRQGHVPGLTLEDARERGLLGSATHAADEVLAGGRVAHAADKALAGDAEREATRAGTRKRMNSARLTTRK